MKKDKKHKAVLVDKKNLFLQNYSVEYIFPFIEKMFPK